MFLLLFTFILSHCNHERENSNKLERENLRESERENIKAQVKQTKINTASKIMKKCELCKLQARTYCESDQASLCWDCDSKVHGANFLVARHSRTLLCRVCHSLTPWKASGEKLGHAVSVCESCINGQEEESRQTNGDDNDEADEEEEMDEDGDKEEEEEEGENQVVPWSALTATPPAYDPSSSDDVSDSANVFSVKRRRLDPLDLHCQDDRNGCSSEQRYGTELLTVQAASVNSASSSKGRETVPYRSRSAAIIVEPRRRERDEGEFGDV